MPYTWCMAFSWSRLATHDIWHFLIGHATWEHFGGDMGHELWSDISLPPLFPPPFNCMFYQLLRVQHSCSSTQSWSSVLFHLLLRWETRIPGVAPFSFRIGIWDLYVHRGQKSYTPTAFGKLWTTPHFTCLIIIQFRYETGPGTKPGTFGLADECSTTELTLLLWYDMTWYVLTVMWLLWSEKEKRIFLDAILYICKELCRTDTLEN